LDSSTTIIVIELFGGNIDQAKPIEVEFEKLGPVWARSAGNFQWTAHLRSPVIIRECRPKPVIKGYNAIQEGQVQAYVIGGECIAHFKFRLHKTWQVEIDSTPRNIRIDSADFQRGFMSTRFKSPVMMWSQELTLTIHCGKGIYYKFELSAGDFTDNKKIVLDKKEMVESMSRTARPGGYFSQLKESKEKEINVQEVLFRMISP
jgi:hypothetical protein